MSAAPTDPRQHPRPDGPGQSVSAIPDMTALRRRIDALDARLIALLAERTRLIDRAAQIKLRDGLPALIESRVEEVAANVRALAAAEGVDPDLADSLWRLMMTHFIDREARFLDARADADTPPEDRP